MRVGRQSCEVTRKIFPVAHLLEEYCCMDRPGLERHPCFITSETLVFMNFFGVLLPTSTHNMLERRRRCSNPWPIQLQPAPTCFMFSSLTRLRLTLANGLCRTAAGLMVCLSVCLCLSVSVCVCLCLSVSVWSGWLVGWFVGLLVCWFVCLFVCLFVCHSLHCAHQDCQLRFWLKSLRKDHSC